MKTEKQIVVKTEDDRLSDELTFIVEDDKLILKYDDKRTDYVIQSDCVKNSKLDLESEDLEELSDILFEYNEINYHSSSIRQLVFFRETLPLVEWFNKDYLYENIREELDSIDEHEKKLYELIVG